MEKVSIIVPLYNNELYISRCIQSLLVQTYSNIEVIIVDDGSTDSSVFQVKKYLYDKRIHLLHQKNSGANIARYRGVKHSTGQFCMFVDSDDYLELHAVESLVNYMNQYSCDIVKFHAVMEPNQQIVNPYSFRDRDIQFVDDNEIFDLLIQTRVLNSLWSCIYKRELLIHNSAFQYRISNAEDYLVNLEVFTLHPKTLFVNEVFYHYCIHDTSITRTSDKQVVLKNQADLLFVYRTLFQYIKRWKVDTVKNREYVSFKILDSIRISVHSLFKIRSLSNRQLAFYINQLLDEDILDDVRKTVSYHQLENIMKHESLIYRLKRYISMKSIYYHNTSVLLFSKYLYRFYYFIQHVIEIVRGEVHEKTN